MILDKIVADTEIRLSKQKAGISLENMRRFAEQSVKANPEHPSFYQALAKPGLSIIGEFKRASPSLGKIHSRIDLTKRIEEYNESVDAVSCLTEEEHFSGSAEYLKEIRTITPLPVLRKDFMIDEYQFYEAKFIGADAVLLIAEILDEAQMRDFYQLSRELDLDVLVETHDERQMERALNLDARIIGVNNRDLRDFTIKIDTTRKLSRMVPKGKILVSESGIVSDKDVLYLKDSRVDAFLIGRAFMEAENPRELARRWKSLK